MGQIYTVGIRLAYDIYEPRYLWIKPYFLRKDSQVRWEKPIFASNAEEAIAKYEARYNPDECEVDPYLANHSIYESLEYRNVKRLIGMVHTSNNYTFDELKKHMNSQDFLEYCRQELIGINEIIK